MSWRTRMDEALDGQGPGIVQVDGERGGRAEVDIRGIDRIGVRVGGVRMTHGHDRDPTSEIDRLTRDLRSLPDRVQPFEVSPDLGGGNLRSRPEEMRNREFFEVEVRGREVDVRKHRVGSDGTREPVEWDFTREQLGRLLDELDG